MPRRIRDADEEIALQSEIRRELDRVRRIIYSLIYYRHLYTRM